MLGGEEEAREDGAGQPGKRDLGQVPKNGGPRTSPTVPTTPAFLVWFL